MNNNKKLFEFDKFFCHCEEGQSPDAAIQEKNFGLLHPQGVSNDMMLIGTDEAGRGPGAGGVFASAVYFNNPNDELIEKLASLNDSKKLSKQKREELYDVILNNTINSTVCIGVEEIEEINILKASLKAMKLACENVIEAKFKRQNAKGEIEQSRLGFPPQQQKVIVLVDGNKLIKDFAPSPEFLELVPRPENLPSPLKCEGLNITQRCIIKGDAKSASIAAASILAKVSRDRYMAELHEKFPQYNWIKNAGYLTKEHLNAIDRYGITPFHRKSFLRKHEEKCNTIQLSMYQK